MDQLDQMNEWMHIVDPRAPWHWNEYSRSEKVQVWVFNSLLGVVMIGISTWVAADLLSAP